MYHFTAVYSFLEIPSSILSQSISNIQLDLTSGSHRLEDDIYGKEVDTTYGISSSPQENSQVPSINDVELARNRSAGSTIDGGQQSIESMKDQWRKVFVNLRRGLKPHEVMVIYLNF